MRRELLNATLLHFQALALESRVNLNIYLNSVSGVAEHPHVVGEVVSLTKKIAEADECIKLINNMLDDRSNE